MRLWNQLSGWDTSTGSNTGSTGSLWQLLGAALRRLTTVVTILSPLSGSPLWMAAPALLWAVGLARQNLGGRNVLCARCAPVLCWAAEAICIGLCYLWLHICSKEPSHFLTAAAHTGLAAAGVFQQASTLPRHFRVLVMCPLRFFCSPSVPGLHPRPIHSFNHYAMITYCVLDTVRSPGTTKTNEVQFLPE